MIAVHEYISANGRSPFSAWFASLGPLAAAKISAAIIRMEMGNTSNIKWFEGIGEFQIDWGPGYRLYLASDGGKLIILFAGGTKATQTRDISKAKELLADYKSAKLARRRLWH